MSGTHSSRRPEPAKYPVTGRGHSTKSTSSSDRMAENDHGKPIMGIATLIVTSEAVTTAE